MLSHSVLSGSLQSHGLQPTRILCPWDFPGKTTGVSCHSLLQGILPTQGLNPGLQHCRQIIYQLSHQRGKVKVTQSCPSFCNPMEYSPWNSPGQNTGVGSLSLLQEIFPTKGLNLGLTHCRQILSGVIIP